VYSPRSFWTAAGVIAGISVAMLAFVAPLIFAGDSPPPPPPPISRCAEKPAQLSGRVFASSEDVPRDLACADLRGAVFDGLDLSQRDFTGADLRGASLRHTDLSQADFVQARLNDADLSFADLTQADCSGADLRGAKLWLTSNIQTMRSWDTRIYPVQPGAIQLGYGMVVAALVLLLQAAIGMVRRVPGPASRHRLRPRARRVLRTLALTFPIMFLIWLMGLNLMGLWTVEVIRPLLISVALLTLTFLMEQLAPSTSAARDPAPSR
jgi:Pentapeptide repeats (8 copies)